MTRIMAKNDSEELERRIRELERENARLKGTNDPQKLVITEGEYQGRPLLTFQRGNSRPFSLGVKKLEAVRDGIDDVKAFLEQHGTPRAKGGQICRFSPSAKMQIYSESKTHCRVLPDRRQRAEAKALIRGLCLQCNLISE